METADLKEAKYRQPSALPPCETMRWVANRKAAVVIAVRDGAISRGIACERYQLSLAELDSWGNRLQTIRHYRAAGELP